MADFTYCPIAQYGPVMETVRYDTFSTLMDDFYALRGSRSGCVSGGGPAADCHHGTGPHPAETGHAGEGLRRHTEPGPAADLR
ncbi:MAG: hypothetical protein ACLTYN_00790 [Dysosmobacter welbionis]